MEIDVIYSPKYENDQCFLSIKDFYISADTIKDLCNKDPYLKLKCNKFRNIDYSKDGFEKFINCRPSLRNFNKMNNMKGTIYTYLIEKNNLSYFKIIPKIKEMLDNKSRRAIVRILNSFAEYYLSHEENIDVSCLSLIHYMEDNVKLIFRASDITNEFIVDLITIYEFFIKPVYYDRLCYKPIINIYMSTVQNVDEFHDMISTLNYI